MIILRKKGQLMLVNIESIFKEREERPLFFVETGSRLWGMVSPDSDYDVRGIHLQSKSQYFDFKRHRDIIEIMDGDLDFVSYDIDKMFTLLSKSNPNVFEWIRSHLIYFNELPNWVELQQNIIANFNFKALYHHYLSLVKGILDLMVADKKFTYKSTFYCIRGLLSSDLAARKTIPELIIDDLFDQFEYENDIIKIAKASLEKKKEKSEKEEVETNEKKLILTSVKNYIIKLENKIPESSNKREKLVKILRDYSYNIKLEYYSN